MAATHPHRAAIYVMWPSFQWILIPSWAIDIIDV